MNIYNIYIIVFKINKLLKGLFKTCKKEIAITSAAGNSDYNICSAYIQLHT